MARKVKPPLPSTPCAAKSTVWQTATLGDVVVHRQVQERDPVGAGFDRYLMVEHLDADRLKIARWGLIADDDLPPTFYKVFRKGQVLYPTRNPHLRRTAYADFDGICGEKTLTLESNGQIEPRLLPFILQTDCFIQYATSMAIGSTNPHVRWRDIAKYEFPLPPKDEQRRIADILWAADEVVETRASVADKLLKSWQRLVDKVLPDPELCPKSRIAKLEDLCSMQNGRPFPSTEYTGIGIKLLRPGNLAAGGRLDWSPDATVFLAMNHAKENADWIVQPGDVVINLTAQSLEDGFMGRVCLAKEGDDSLLNQRLGRFVCGAGVRPEYVFRILQTTRFRRLVESRCEGSKVRHTYFRHFADMPVVVMDTKDQDEVIEGARKIDSARDATLNAVAAARALLRQLREHLLNPRSVDHDLH